MPFNLAASGDEVDIKVYWGRTTLAGLHHVESRVNGFSHQKVSWQTGTHYTTYTGACNKYIYTMVTPTIHESIFYIREFIKRIKSTFFCPWCLLIRYPHYEGCVSFFLLLFLSFTLSVVYSFCLLLFLSFTLSVFYSFCLLLFLSFFCSFTLSLFLSIYLSFSHSLSHSVTQSVTQSLTHSLTQSLSHSLTHPPTHSLIHSLTHSVSHSLTHSLTHPLTHPLFHYLSFFCSLNSSLSHPFYLSIFLVKFSII